MIIDKVYGLNPINNVQNSKRTAYTGNSKVVSDEISVSDEAKAMADAYYLRQVADETPDVRQDLVEQVKQKIQDPNYLNADTIAATADRILSAYGL